MKAGDLFRHYRVIERVGEGGMGVVYRARDTRLDRDVALKFIVHAAPLNSEHADRLRREARALAALNHPNILTIHDIGDADGLPFLVLEWVGAGALSDASSPRPLSTREFLRIVLPVADALGAAHRQGIVHRDVKPANVLVCDDGRIKLADFGLAKFRDLNRDTRTGGVAGTLAYMSPEQASGEEVGPASDIFSLGILAYELLTGRLPFEGDSPGAVIAAILGGRHTPVTEMGSRVPGAVTAVVERCLEREPEARFQSGSDVAREFRRAYSGSELPAAVEKMDTDDHPRIDAPAARQQEIRFYTTADGVSLAYSPVGAGPFIVRVLGHFTHLEMEWEWPDLRRFWEQLAERFTVVRYDGRGMSLSDPYNGDFTEETRQLDLDAVLNAVGAEKTALLGISEGGWTAATYVLQHPGRVTHLIPLRRVQPRSPGAAGIRCGGRPGAPDTDPQGLGTGHPPVPAGFHRAILPQRCRSPTDRTLQRAAARLNHARDSGSLLRVMSSKGRRTGSVPADQDSCARHPFPRRSGRECGRGAPAGVDHSRRATRAAPQRHALFPDGRGGRREGRGSDRSIPYGSEMKRHKAVLPQTPKGSR